MKISFCSTTRWKNRKMATRATQIVSSMKQRKFVIDWMIKEVNRWLNEKEELLNALSAWENRMMYVRSKYVPGLVEKQIAVKALHGRGRKLQDWVKYLHEMLLSEFDRLISSDLQLSCAVIQYFAFTLLAEENSTYKSSDIDLASSRRITEHITMKWVDSFLSPFNIAVRRQSGTLYRSPSQTTFIERNVAYNLGYLQRLFESGLLHENMFENMFENHFIFNMDNSKMHSFRGSNKVNYAEVVCGFDGFTMVPRLKGGADAKLIQPFLFSKIEIGITQ